MVPDHLVAKLRAAQEAIDRHGREVADLEGRLKTLRKDKARLAAALTDAMDQLTGRATPDLPFGDPAADAAIVPLEQLLEQEAEADAAADPGNLSGWRACPVEDLGLSPNDKVAKALGRAAVGTLGEAADALRAGDHYGLPDDHRRRLCELIDDAGADDPAHVPLVNPPGDDRTCGVCGEGYSAAVARPYAARGVCSEECLRDKDSTGPVQPAVAAGQAAEDEALRRACSRFQGAVTRWDKLRAKGATAAELAEAIGSEFGDGGGTGPGLLAYRCRGGKQPAVWFGDTNHVTDPPSLTGAPLVAAVRRLLDIPSPEEAAARAEAARKVKAAARPYGWSLTYLTTRGETLTCHYAGTEATARKKTLLRPNAKGVLSAQGLTEAEYVRAYGKGRA